jgi:hypothetical protein
MFFSSSISESHNKNINSEMGRGRRKKSTSLLFFIFYIFFVLLTLNNIKTPHTIYARREVMEEEES